MNISQPIFGVVEIFSFEHISTTPKIGDSFHFHNYQLLANRDKYRLSLFERASTDADGIALCLGLKAEANVELEVILKMVESKISERTLLKLQIQMLRKIGFYILSLWLLFLLIIIITVEIPIYSGEEWEFVGFKYLIAHNVIPIICVILLIIGGLSYFDFRYKTKGTRVLYE